LTILKASSAVPLLYRKPVLHRGKRLVSGAYLEPLPLAVAIADGCTDVLVLACGNLREPPSQPPPWLRPWLHRSVNPRRSAACREAWLEGRERLRQAREMLINGESPTAAGKAVHLSCASPPDDLQLPRWETGHRRLVAAVIEGAYRVFDLFGISRRELQPHQAIRLLA
jgi:predicted acylesterase/phospholipase RssA